MLQNSTSHPSRNLSLDAVAGIFIIYMILGHAFIFSQTTDDSFYKGCGYVLSMFMTWFFFKSGIYYRKQSDPKVAIKKWARKLLIPFVIYTLVGEMLLWISQALKGTSLGVNELIVVPVKEIIIFGSLHGNFPLWFLVTLFLVKTIIALCDQYGIKKQYLFLTSFIISGGGTVVQSYIPHLPLWILNTALGINFYLVGYWLREKQYDWRVLLVSVAIFLGLDIFLHSEIDFRTDSAQTGYWLSAVVQALAGVVVFNNLFKLKLFQLPVLASIGRNSMDYYCAHWLVIELTLIIIPFHLADGLPSYTLLWTLIFAFILVLPCYSYWKKLFPKFGL